MRMVDFVHQFYETKEYLVLLRLKLRSEQDIVGKLKFLQILCLVFLNLM